MIAIAIIEVTQRRADTPVESHYQGADLADARRIARRLSETGDGTDGRPAYIKKNGKCVAKWFRGQRYSPRATV